MRSKSPELMSEIKKYIEDYYLQNRQSPSTTKIAEAVGIARGTAYKYLVEMAEKNMIEYDGQEIRTLKDVAKETGLTVSTVSRVLNNRGYISEETRKKVYEAMKKLNYRPNEVARSLSKQTTNTIGVIVPHIRHPYFAELISNLESQAYHYDHKILLFNSQEKNEKEWEYMEMCTSNRVAGVILCSGTVGVEKSGVSL